MTFEDVIPKIPRAEPDEKVSRPPVYSVISGDNGSTIVEIYEVSNGEITPRDVVISLEKLKQYLQHNKQRVEDRYSEGKPPGEIEPDGKGAYFRIDVNGNTVIGYISRW